MVQLGCAVIPVVPYEKRAAIKNWRNETSKDPSLIKKHFSANPTANYGTITGAQSGIIVVDLDGGKGVTNWYRLEKLP
jgi:bifunctional DNA primase/polymerase-like protein